MVYMHNVLEIKICLFDIIINPSNIISSSSSFHIIHPSEKLNEKKGSNSPVDVEEIDQQENGGSFTETVCISFIDESECSEEEMEIAKADLHVEGKDEFSIAIPRLVAKVANAWLMRSRIATI